MHDHACMLFQEDAPQTNGPKIRKMQRLLLTGKGWMGMQREGCRVAAVRSRVEEKEMRGVWIDATVLETKPM